MISIDKETAMRVLDILAELPYREVETVFKQVAVAVIQANEQTEQMERVENPRATVKESEIILPGVK